MWAATSGRRGVFSVRVLLSALFQRYVPRTWSLFGGTRPGASDGRTIGYPLCLRRDSRFWEWLWEGMSIGSAAAFMLTGPATKITNLGALKIVLGMKRFLLYWAFVLVFSLLTALVNLIL